MRTIIALRAGVFRPGRFNFLAIGLGFIFQTAFLSIRGHELHRCPLTNLFEVLIFLAWSIALIYMLIGPAYRLSLMGAFTAPLVFLIQTLALLAPIDVRHPVKLPANAWLEFHASAVDRGVWCVRARLRRWRHVSRAGTTAQDASTAFSFLSSSAANGPLRGDHATALAGIRALYGWTCQRFLHRCAIATRSSSVLHSESGYSTLRSCKADIFVDWRRQRVAALCIVGFAAALTLLWGITFTAQTEFIAMNLFCVGLKSSHGERGNA